MTVYNFIPVGSIISEISLKNMGSKNKSEEVGFKFDFSINQTLSGYNLQQHMQKNLSFHLMYHMIV